MLPVAVKAWMWRNSIAWFSVALCSSTHHLTSLMASHYGQDAHSGRPDWLQHRHAKPSGRVLVHHVARRNSKIGHFGGNVQRRFVTRDTRILLISGLVHPKVIGLADSFHTGTSLWQLLVALRLIRSCHRIGRQILASWRVVTFLVLRAHSPPHRLTN